MSFNQYYSANNRAKSELFGAEMPNDFKISELSYYHYGAIRKGLISHFPSKMIPSTRGLLWKQPQSKTLPDV